MSIASCGLMNQGDYCLKMITPAHCHGNVTSNTSRPSSKPNAGLNLIIKSVPFKP